MFHFTVQSLKIRLDRYLKEQLADISRTKIQNDIEAGAVKVNDVQVTESKFVVRLADRIEYSPIPENRDKYEPKDIPLKTLYNNHGLLIIDKPPGLSVHPGSGFEGDSLTQALLYHFKDIKTVGEEGRPGIVHRLDKDTSGVMVVALTQPMYEHLKEAFGSRHIKKYYIALVKGKILETHRVIDLPIGKSKQDFRKMTADPDDMIEAKPSKTEYWVLEHLKGPKLDDYTLIKVQLHTGRTHQIRVHFNSFGFPLAGDTLYGPKVKPIGLERQFLHAASIELQLPDGTLVEAESKLPDDLRTILQKMGSNKVDSI
jgi:23S rRNA pseudouridine1911/1915/1917 synthase